MGIPKAGLWSGWNSQQQASEIYLETEIESKSRGEIVLVEKMLQTIRKSNV